MKKFIQTMSQLSRGVLGLAVGLLLAIPVSAETLTVYTAVEAEDLKRYAAAFNEDHPDIEIRWVRDSTGIVTAKLLAEKNNPRADIIWGLAATSLMLLQSEGMLQPYAPKGLGKLDSKFRDSANPPSWTGMDAWIAAVCVNTVEATCLRQLRGWTSPILFTRDTSLCRIRILPEQDSLTSLHGFRFLENEEVGNLWTTCTRTLPGTPIPVQSPANKLLVVKLRLAFHLRFAEQNPKPLVRLWKSFCRKKAWAGTWKQQPS